MIGINADALCGDELLDVLPVDLLVDLLVHLVDETLQPQHVLTEMPVESSSMHTTSF